MTVIHVAAHRPRNTSRMEWSKATLEEEIRLLRGRMEDAALLEQSFTSENVIQLSMLMDEKINEYNAFITDYKLK